jgi:hypothetical protein
MEIFDKILTVFWQNIKCFLTKYLMFFDKILTVFWQFKLGTFIESQSLSCNQKCKFFTARNIHVVEEKRFYESA